MNMNELKLTLQSGTKVFTHKTQDVEYVTDANEHRCYLDGVPHSWETMKVYFTRGLVSIITDEEIEELIDDELSNGMRG